MMRQHHRVECVIVESDRAPGELSIRPVEVLPGEGGKATTFRRRLKDAGFRVSRTKP